MCVGVWGVKRGAGTPLLSLGNGKGVIQDDSITISLCLQVGAGGVCLATAFPQVR